MNLYQRNNAIFRSNLEPSWRLVLLSLSAHMSETNFTCWIATETIAEETGLARSSVMDSLTEMAKHGIVERYDAGHRTKNTRIVWEAVATFVPVKSARGGSRKKDVNPSAIRTVGSVLRTAVSEDRTVPSDYRSVVSDNRTDTGQNNLECITSVRLPDSTVRSSDGRCPIIGRQVSDNRTRSDHDPYMIQNTPPTPSFDSTTVADPAVNEEEEDNSQQNPEDSCTQQPKSMIEPEQTTVNQEEIDRIVKDALAKKSANNEENPPDDDPPKVTVLQQALLRRGVPSSSATTRPVPKPIPFPGGGDIFGRNRTTASANPAPVAIPPPKPVEAIPDTMLPPEVTDLNVLLTTRPDGEQALPGAIVQRWIRALVNAGITSPKQLENMTFDNLKYTSGIGENVAMKVSTAMMLWGSSLAPEPRVRMQELRAMAARNLSMPSDVNARDRRWLKAASISWNDIRKMTDYDVIDFSKRLESAKRAESMVAA